jgi:hypothetical protein
MRVTSFGSYRFLEVPMLEKLLLAVDDSAKSRKAVPAAAELAWAVTGGSPAGVILQHARELGAGMVVVGSQGRTSLGGLQGSVAHKVIQLSTCPVLVVRDEQSLEARHHAVRRFRLGDVVAVGEGGGGGPGGAAGGADLGVDVG